MFLAPVNPLLAPGYLDIVAHPIDLATIAERIEAGYPSAWLYLVRAGAGTASLAGRPGHHLTHPPPAADGHAPHV